MHRTLSRPSALFGLIALVAACLGCRRDETRTRLSRAHTLGELRTVKRGVAVAPPNEAARAPYPRERLVDGERITLDPGGVAWIRRDGGATLLVSGPASLVVHEQALELARGRVFVDTLASTAARLTTPRGELALARLRASIEVSDAGGLSAYVLEGAVHADAGPSAGPGERLDLTPAGRAQKTAVSTWEDWTGGLATTDPAAQPAPFGIGTVGARPPGNLGQPRFALGIRRLDVRVKIDGDFAATEVDQVFSNPTSDTLEGIFGFRTPEGSTLAKFGVDRDAAMVWGYVKERGAARGQYQGHVYQGSAQAPALLEWESPGVYKARLYPIEARKTRRVVTRYTEWLARQGSRAERRLYVYPMAAEGAEASLPRIEELEVRIDVSGAAAREVRVGMQGVSVGGEIVVKARDFVPRADLAVELFDDGLPDAVAYRARHAVDTDALPPGDVAPAIAAAKNEPDYVLFPVRAQDIAEPAGGIDLGIVIDTSAATEPGDLAVARATTRALLAHLGPGDRAAVWAGDATLRPVAEGADHFAPVDAARRDAIASGLARIDRGGATDLGAILATAAAALDPSRRGAIVYVGDGRPTVGETAAAELRERLGRLSHPVRLFAVGVGDRADLGLLSAVARGAFAVRVTDAYAAARAALRVLESAERPARVDPAIDLGPGVDRIVPREIGALAAGETAFVVGRATPQMARELLVRGPGSDAGRRISVRTIDDRCDLRRRWALGRIAQLVTEGAARSAIVELGLRAAVITPVTSLYVPTGDEQQKQAEAVAARKTATEHEAADNREGGTGIRAKGEEGSMGSPNRRYAVQADPHVAREAALREQAEFGMIGMLNSGSGADPNAPAAPWGSDDAFGADPLAARGNMWGSDVGDAHGAGALGLTGIGEGGGGAGEGIGIGSIGTASKSGQGFGSGNGRLSGHSTTGPQVRMQTAQVNGRLPPEAIQRVVRQNYGRFRLCYENGLRANPNLQGRVSVRFVIGRDGAVSNVSNGGSDLPDAAVVNCVSRAFYGLTFPQPEGGIVTIVYPIFFSPEGGPDPRQAERDARAAEDHARAAAAEAQKAADAAHRIVTNLASIGHEPAPCSAAADLPFDERRALFRERIAKGTSPDLIVRQYEIALKNCEANNWRERTQLLMAGIDMLPQVRDRVALWRALPIRSQAADIVFQGVLTRVYSGAEIRELHDALGLRQIDPDILARAIARAKTPAERVSVLGGLCAAWPDDQQLALAWLEAYEDAGDDAGGRSLARRMRARRDATTRVRTAVGEYYLRLAKRAPGTAAERDQTEARRTFGEIVEFAPDDPGARRRLGDLLRAHGWYEEAFRQYETLARLQPEDPSVSLALAAAAQGMGRTEEAIRWTEKAEEGCSPDGRSALSRTARAMASAFLAWARRDALGAGRADEADRLRERARRLAQTDEASHTIRWILTWAHPELRPSLYAGGPVPQPAPNGDPLLGVAETTVPSAVTSVDVVLLPADAATAARLAPDAAITAIVDEGTGREKIVKAPVSFSRRGDRVIAKRRFALDGDAIREEVL